MLKEFWPSDVFTYLTARLDIQMLAAGFAAAASVILAGGIVRSGGKTGIGLTAFPNTPAKSHVQLVIFAKKERLFFGNLPVFAFITKFLLQLQENLAMMTIAQPETIPVAFPKTLSPLAKF